MTEFLQDIIGREGSAEDKLNRLRETLQLLLLKILQEKGYFSNLAFVGGTALRVLYDLRRFSEDLDFSVIGKNGYDFSDIIANVKNEFRLYGLEVEAGTKDKKTVQESMLKFPRLLKELGISGLGAQKLSIKIESDSNPPSGWRLEKTVVNKIYLLNITHFDLPSLYSTKIHACFFRRYVKGRDFYDFLWYLGRKTKPNYNLLNNAVMQTEGTDPRLSEKNIKNFLLDKTAKVDFNDVRKDVSRFLEDKKELALLDKTTILKSIEDVFKGQV